MSIVDLTHFHLFCGSGGGGKGFNRSNARLGALRTRSICIGGVDVDPLAIKDFERHVGVKGTVLDLFTREQYIRFHGHEPPHGWCEAMPEDIFRAAGCRFPNIGFTSSPCKGLSGLLSETKSKSQKYTALNELTLRGTGLCMEAFVDDPMEFFLFENVPRIMNRGRHLLDDIIATLKYYGYIAAETTHDCGELGGLAQSRKRFLLVARHAKKVPAFLYEPPKRQLQSVGSVLEKFPLPGDPRGGPMHRVPALQWKTWVRLAFVEAGKDWRSLNRLNVKDGYLTDYLIVPEMHRGVLGVTDWDETAGVITSNGRPVSGKFSVADPRAEVFRAGYGVNRWNQHCGAVQSESFPSNGNFSVADPRVEGHHKSVQMGVRRWKDTAGVVTSKMFVGSGPNSVADPRIEGVRHNNVFRVVKFTDTSPAVTAGMTPTSGGLNVADPRTNYSPNSHRNKLAVINWGEKAKTVTGSKQVQGGALSVADPRPAGLTRERGDDYLTAGHYGVVPWLSHAYAVTGSGRHDNGHNNVADPRLPAANDRLVAVIRSEDGTWHRPFTTLELAALQSYVDPDEYLVMAGTSDSAWRERIGNMVPPDTAEAIGNVMHLTILLARAGETFQLNSTPVWVRDVAIAASLNLPA